MSEVHSFVASSADASTVDQDPKPKSKRSPVERVLVWGGIALLSVVVGSELIAQRGFSSTLNGLEETFDNGTLLTEAELPSHIHGFCFKDEEKIDGVRILSVQWPSLFRTYKIRMPVAVGNVICVVETDRIQFDPLNDELSRPIQSTASDGAQGN